MGAYKPNCINQCLSCTLKVEKFACTNFRDRNFREFFWKAVFREIRENKFSRSLKNRSYAKFAKLFSHKNFNAWKSSILRYLPKLILGQNWAQNIMISLEYHHFELNIIERNPQDGGSLMICALWWCYGMVGWSKTNVSPPRPNMTGPQFENKFSPKFKKSTTREIRENFSTRNTQKFLHSRNSLK